MRLSVLYTSEKQRYTRVRGRDESTNSDASWTWLIYDGLPTHTRTKHARTNERARHLLSHAHTNTNTHTQSTRSPPAVHPHAVHPHAVHTQSTRAKALRVTSPPYFLLCKVSLTESRSARSARAAPRWPRQRAEILEEILDLLYLHTCSRGDQETGIERRGTHQVNQAPRNALVRIEP